MLATMPVLTKPIFESKWMFCLMGTLLLLLGAFYNGFPLLNPDDGTYLNVAFTNSTAADRPPFYSFFIAATAVYKTIWLPIIFQCLLLSFLIVEMILVWLPSAGFKMIGLIFFLLVALTPIAWFSGQLSADIFCAIMILSLVLFLEQSAVWKSIIFASIFFFSLLTHNSNVFSALAFLIFCLVWIYFFHKSQIKKVLQLTTITILAFFTICTVNLIEHQSFTFSKVGHVFLMGKLIEAGILKQFLDDNCRQENYPLCAYKDSLPSFASDFIWLEQSPFHKTGGWDNSKESYNHIIHQTLTQPKYIKLHALESITKTASLLRLTYAGDGFYNFSPSSNVYQYVKNLVPNDLIPMLAAKQQQDKLNLDIFNSLYIPFLLLSTFLLLIFSYVTHQKFRFYIAVVLGLIVTNAFVAATFANILSRLNARVIWLIPLLFILLLFKEWNNILKPMKELIFHHKK